jgi:hypothetical protein
MKFMNYQAQDWRARKRKHLCKYCKEKFEGYGRKLTVCNPCRPRSWEHRTKKAKTHNAT